jgi:hypothetical protein
MKNKFLKMAVTGLVLSVSGFANAGLILVVSDATTDTSIGTALSNAGHSVDTSINQYNSGETLALLNDLTSYDAVYWSATGNGYGDLNNSAAMFSNLTNYANGGGNIFVTGYDSISSPNDPTLIAFLGGSNNIDNGSAPNAIANIENSLTTGLFDIRGLTPSTTGNQTTDRDSLGGLGGDTVGIVESGFAGSYYWTLRTIGLGEVAYVSNGNHIGALESENWTDSNSPYHMAVLNFAHNAGTVDVPAPSTLAILSLGLMGLAARRFKKQA